jgi:hypothetical protein
MTAENLKKMMATASRRGSSTRGNMRVTDTGSGCFLFTLYGTDIVRTYRDKANRRRIKFNAAGWAGTEIGNSPNCWNTRTTRKNINAVCDALGFAGRVSSKDGAPYAVNGDARRWADDPGGMDFPFPIA